MSTADLPSPDPRPVKGRDRTRVPDMSESARTGLRALRDRGLVPGAVLVAALHATAYGDVDEAVWMAREGLDLLSGLPLVHRDQWSWDPQPWEFVPTSPGWQFISASMWTQFGAAGFFFLSFVASIACLSVAAWLGGRLHAKPTHVVISLLFISIMAGGQFGARSALLAFALFLANLQWIWQILHKFKSNGTLRIVGAIAAIDAGVVYAGLWLHQSWGTYAIALALVQLVFTHRLRRQLADTVAVGCAGGLAITAALLAGPSGLQIWSETARVAEACRGIILEWKSPLANGDDWTFLWASCVVIALVVLRRTWMARTLVTEIHWVLLCITFAALVVGTQAIRFIPIAAIALAPVLAASLGWPTADTSLPKVRRRLGERASESYWRNVFALALVPLTVAATVNLGRISTSPDTAFQALPRNCNLFSNDTAAKSVVLYRPDVRIWIDGRHHYWGRDRLLRAIGYLEGTGELLPAGTSCLMLKRTAAPLLQARINANPDWTFVAESSTYRVWMLKQR